MKGKQAKMEMALLGYFNTVDFAKLIGVSKQAVCKNKQHDRLIRYGRPWYKYDDGQIGHELYPKANKTIDKFIEFGMKRRGASMAIDTMPVEIKRISSELVSVRLYNELGDMMVILASPSQIERINYESDI
jgi:hypothetical protein